mgnify:CR=1 FL=1
MAFILLWWLMVVVVPSSLPSLSLSSLLFVSMPVSVFFGLHSCSLVLLFSAGVIDVCAGDSGTDYRGIKRWWLACQPCVTCGVCVGG